MKIASKDSDRRSRRTISQLGVALVLSASGLDAGAAGLGRLNLMSGIGQPLRAEIEVTSLNKDEAGSLTARLASADAFGQAGIEFGSALSGLRFSIQRRAGGQPYVLVTSNALVNDPYLDMLVELSWSSGRLVREYTMLLDPPETRAARTGVDPGQTVVQAQSAAPAAAAPRSSDAAGSRASSATSVPASGGDYVVKSGDTAMSIARANKPESVSLEQMLAALYRDNPQAFNGNINRLMAGASVKVPDAASAQGLDGAEAHRIVAQSANFGRYRDRLAQNAASVPTSRADRPQASGRLSTQVQDNSAPATEARDRLQLSRPDATRAPAATASAPSAGRPSTEELAAKDRELTESRSRLAALEKNVADLQQLLKLKNQTLAELQKGVAATPAAPAATPVMAPPVAAPVPSPAPAPAPAPAPVITPPPAAAPAVAPVAAPPVAPVVTPPVAVPTPAPAPAKAAPAPIQATTDTGTWYDALLDNTLLLAGLIVLALLLFGYGLVTMRRRRKLASFEDSIFVDNSVLHANSVFGTTGGQSVDTANTGFHSNFVPVAGSLPDQTEVDPVAEADVYVAYGRDAQAEEILKEALRNDGSRQAVRQKLLEIYAKRGDAKSFETTASELYAATGGQGDDWKQAAALGASIDPRNPLYADADAGTSTPASVPAPIASNAPSAAERAAAIAAAHAAFSFSDIGSGASDERPPAPATADHTRTDPLPRSSTAPAAAPPSMDLDFDLGLGGGSVAPLHAGGTSGGAAPSLSEDTFDFDTSESSKPLIDPFTASAFSGNDSAIRTAVNLPAFRARADQPETGDRTSAPPAPPAPPTRDNEGFTASDIFGSSIVADSEPYSPMPRESSPASTQTSARTSDFRPDPNAHSFEKTEPLNAFNKISLDLDHDDFAPSQKSDFGAKTEVWQAMATKLDLALAYSDIGDKDGARELLEEVVRNGDETQSDRARTLIGQLD